MSEKFIDAYNITDFKITQYFLKSFIKRNELKYITLHGEAGSADMSKIEEFKLVLKEKLKIYPPQNIFNIDETRIYIKKTSDKSFVISPKNDNKNIKSEKTRISVLLGCSYLGEKLRPLIIAKSKNPRCFKNFNFDKTEVLYRANKTSWLTAKLFNEYYGMLNNKLKNKPRKTFIDC